jgi:hypothetical protein
LINLSNSFTLRHLTNDLVYRRPSPDEPVSDPWHTAAQVALASSDSSGGVE